MPCIGKMVTHLMRSVLNIADMSQDMERHALSLMGRTVVHLLKTRLTDAELGALLVLMCH